MVVKLANNSTFDFRMAFEGEEFFNGSNRRVLTLECKKTDEISIDTLYSRLSSETNTATIKLINDEDIVTNTLGGYVLLLAVGIKQRYIENLDLPPETEDYIEIKLGKRTPIEQQLFDLGIG